MAEIKQIDVGGTVYDIVTWTKVSYDEEPYYIEAQDRHEYYLTGATELVMDLPTTDKYEIWIKLQWATDCEPLFMFSPEVPFIGGEPTWQSGCTYEVSVKDGVAVAAQAGEL